MEPVATERLASGLLLLLLGVFWFIEIGICARFNKEKNSFMATVKVGIGLDYFRRLPFFPDSIRSSMGYMIIVLSFVLFALVLREFSNPILVLTTVNRQRKLLLLAHFVIHVIPSMLV